MTDEEIIRMAREAGFEILGGEIGINDRWHIQTDLIKRLIYVVAAAEREACAKVCETVNSYYDSVIIEGCAAAIRARGEK